MNEELFECVLAILSVGAEIRKIGLELVDRRGRLVDLRIHIAVKRRNAARF